MMVMEVRDAKNLVNYNNWTKRFLDKNCIKDQGLIVEAGKILEKVQILRKEEYNRFDSLPGIDIPLYKYTTNEGYSVFEFIEYIHGEDPATIFLGLMDESNTVFEESRESFEINII